MRMGRFILYLGVASAILFSLIVSFVWEAVIPAEAPMITAPTASSTLSVMPAIVPTAPPPSSVPEKVPAPSPTVSAPAKVEPTPAPTLSAEEAAALLEESAYLLRAALVNIICYAPAESGLHSISGSGVIVDSKGIILTNAHIAQYFLLYSRGISCTIRAGSPASDRYEAAIIYISPAWITTNATILTQENPTGTGEYDFAFLAITKPAPGASALPSSFPSIPLALSPTYKDAPVVIASYGAQFLESSQIQSSLFPTVVFGSVKNVFTFSTTVDVLALGGSAAAQEVSSGGGISDIKGELVGTITTSTTNGAIGARRLGAITATYIRAEYEREAGNTLDTLLAQPIATAIAVFAPQIPTLEAILTANL